MPHNIDTTGLTTGLMLLLEDADRIEALPRERFDMMKVGSTTDALRGECESPACVGGWVRAWSGIPKGIASVGKLRWGLNPNALMSPGDRRMANGKPAYDAAPAQAAQAMRNLAWSEAANPGHGDPAWEMVI